MNDINAISSKPRITVAYLRTASRNQSQGGFSLVAQRNTCEDYARASEPQRRCRPVPRRAGADVGDAGVGAGRCAACCWR